MVINFAGIPVNKYITFKHTNFMFYRLTSNEVIKSLNKKTSSFKILLIETHESSYKV